MASSTFHDFVNKGKIIPLKGIRGFYKLNNSLRRLGLRGVPELAQEVPSRTAEELHQISGDATFQHQRNTVLQATALTALIDSR